MLCHYVAAIKSAGYSEPRKDKPPQLRDSILAERTQHTGAVHKEQEKHNTCTISDNPAPPISAVISDSDGPKPLHRQASAPPLLHQRQIDGAAHSSAGYCAGL